MLGNRSSLRGSTVNRRILISSAKLPKYGHALSAGIAPLVFADAAMALEETVVGSGATDLFSVMSDNPLIASAAVLLTVGGVAVASSFRPARTTSTAATDAFEALKAEERCVLVDVRPKSALKEEGVVDLKEAAKKPLNIVYAELDEDGGLAVDPNFATNVQQADGISETSIIILLDSDGKLSPKAAADLAESAFFKEKVYWVRGGMEGPQGWKESDLPTKPYRIFELPLPSLELPSVDLAALAAGLQAQVPGVDLQGTVDKVNEAVTVISDKYKENPTLANGVLAAAGIAAVGAFALTELDAILQVMGALGMARFLANNLLFAKDREATLATIRTFLQERGFDVPNSSGAAGAPSAGSSGGSQMQKLANIVMEAPDGDSAAKQIAEQMGPDVKNVDVGALAAALAAAGIELPPPAAAPTPPAAVAETAALRSAAPAAAESQTDDAPVQAAAVVVSAAEVELPAAAPALGPFAPPTPPAGTIPTTAAVAETISEAVATAPVATPESSPHVGLSVPQNVMEVREWIAAWKARGSEAPAPTAAAVLASVEAEEGEEEVPESGSCLLDDGVESALAPANVVAARQWITAWKRARVAARDAVSVAPADRPTGAVVVVGGDGASESDPATPVVEAVAEEQDAVLERATANVMA